MSTLVAHNPKFNAQLATYEQLCALPLPPAMGPRHRPVPHAQLVQLIRNVASERSLPVIRERFALGSNGHSLFAVMDFESAHSDRALSLGFRNSTDQSIGLAGVAGSSVFVCDNLALAGDWDTWSHKNTTGLNLGDLIRAGFDVFARRTLDFEASVARLSAAVVSDQSAAAKLWEVFAAGTLPARYLQQAHTNYFQPDASWTDCTPRTEWGVYNALTRIARELAPTRALDVGTEIGAHFGLGRVIDTTAVGVQS